MRLHRVRPSGNHAPNYTKSLFALLDERLLQIACHKKTPPTEPEHHSSGEGIKPATSNGLPGPALRILTANHI